MSQSTLSLTYQQLKQRLGFGLGYGRGPDVLDGKAWTTKQNQALEQILQSGLSLFYHNGHEWSFLKPTARLTLAEGENSINLPDDYTATTGEIIVSTGDSAAYLSLGIGSAGEVRRRQEQQSDTTGPPQYLAEGPLKGTALTHGQRLQFLVWPKADQDYTLVFPYTIAGNFLSGSLPYAYGGPQHAETLLAACKYVAERDLDGHPGQGPMEMAWKNALDASIKMDRRNKGQFLGRNEDRSDQMRRRSGGLPRSFLPVLIDGVEYG